jgi:hypothetical protein
MRACSTHAEKRNVYKILVRKLEGKKRLGRLGGRIILTFIFEKENGVVWA